MLQQDDALRMLKALRAADGQTVSETPLADWSWEAPISVRLGPSPIGGDIDLVYELSQGIKIVRATPDLLTEFLALHGADAKAFQTFAVKWGPLELCGHGEPYRHNHA